jgi:hypothetical protein
MTMSYRLFGRTGLRVSKFFLGAMTFGNQGGVGAPLEECRRIVDAYADAGGNVTGRPGGRPCCSIAPVIADLNSCPHRCEKFNAWSTIDVENQVAAPSLR